MTVVRCGRKQREVIGEAARDNARRRAAAVREKRQQLGPRACSECGAQPCGHLYPDARCCNACTHVYPDDWEQTHTAYESGHEHPVMELRLSEQVRAFVRPDGLIEWLEISEWTEEGELGRRRVLYHGRRPNRAMLEPAQAGEDGSRREEAEPGEWVGYGSVQLSEVEQLLGLAEPGTS